MNKNLTTIYLVRHGESEANLKQADDETFNPITNYDDFGAPLTEKGQIQAKALAERLKHIHFDAIFSSDLRRAQHTAQAVALERSIAVKASNMIRERAFTLYYNQLKNIDKKRLMQEMANDLAKLDELGKRTYKHTSKMESVEESAVRMLTFLREVAIAYPGKPVLVANHGNMIRSVLTKMGWATFNELPHGSVENTGYIVLESDGVDFFIKETYGVHKIKDAIRSW